MKKQDELLLVDEKIKDGIAKDIWQDLVADSNINPSADPKGYFIAGQPGAGKSNSITNVESKLKGNVVSINVDDYRKYHPNFKAIDEKYGPLYTNEFADSIRDRLIDKALDGRFNIIVEGTMKGFDSTRERLEQFKSHGYQSNVIVQTCPKEVSWKGIRNRYDSALARGETPRDVPKAFHDAVVEALPINADKIYQSGLTDSFKVCSRDGELFDSSTSKELPSKSIKAELDRPLNSKEQNLVNGTEAGQLKVKSFGEYRQERPGREPNPPQNNSPSNGNDNLSL